MKTVLILHAFLLLGQLFGCSQFLRAGARYVYFDQGGHGLETAASMDLGDNAGIELLPADAKGKKSFLTFGADLSLGTLVSGDAEVADNLIGSGFLTANFNHFRTSASRQWYQGLRVNLGLGTRVQERNANLAIQGGLQLAAGTFADLCVVLEAVAGYMPGEENVFFGVGISLGNFYAGSVDPGLPLGGVR